MTENIQIIIDGKKIELPFNINELFSQLSSQERTPSPQQVFPKPQPLFPSNRPQSRFHKQEPFCPRPKSRLRRVRPTQQMVKKIIMCKDIPARNVIMDLNKRITKLEELLKALLKVNKPTKKVVSTKEVSKSKKIPKTKEILKNKSKIMRKKVGKKK